ncbi:MAG: hypothetical protein K0S39_4908 [Paenibacillus sp.]|jgi:hypothetical protein|nr:hypothetical protein [Paenibacillus sp.]
MNTWDRRDADSITFSFSIQATAEKTDRREVQYLNRSQDLYSVTRQARKNIPGLLCFGSTIGR